MSTKGDGNIKLERITSSDTKREQKKARKKMLEKIRRQGYAFESKISASLNVLSEQPKYINKGKKRIWARKLVDTYSLDRASKYGECSVVIPKVPGDYEVFFNGRVSLIEAKTSSLDKYDLGNIKPHQLEASELTENTGSPYWFLFYHIGSLEVYGIPGFAIRRLVELRGSNPVPWSILSTLAKTHGKREPLKDGLLDLSFALPGPYLYVVDPTIKATIRTLLTEEDILKPLF